MTGCTSGGYDQLETSPEAIEQELRPAVCERRQTDLRQIITLYGGCGSYFLVVPPPKRQGCGGEPYNIVNMA